MNAPTASHWTNAQGYLVPIDKIKPIDKERNDLVLSIVDKARKQQEELRKFKNQTFADIAAFVQLSAEQYEVVIGGKKGNITLFSFDGKYKIVRQIQDNIKFDERLQAAKALIDQCINTWIEDSNDNIRMLINDAFSVDKEGKISTGKVLGLRRMDIKDPQWLKAMDAISDSIIVVDSKAYVRIYERDENGKYQPISLDFSNV
ncbi:DUF3164 family protein [Acinetobacter haemolyticus]|uniref:DUF3164 family protein n=1 Tax=Acinetobacter haemolyticus TaxID=29430 RepID=UPI0021CD50DB|nr:DUF3164 family protein [Acinetobacter haemolyticus]MCU4378245.1 DUF3164 family protein [Acinetobacter haemolyticus]WPO67591.1 DUF3164 family protein [Acinetobacter haemolyticus]